MGTLYKNDLDRIQIKQFKEAAKLRGTQVVFFETSSKTKDLYTDFDVETFPEEHKIDVLFQTFPQNKRTLMQEGWYNKDKEEENPITMQIPLDFPMLDQWQKILIPNNTQHPTSKWRLYEITHISTRVEHPFFYLVAVVPYYLDDSPELDRTQNQNFLIVDL